MRSVLKFMKLGIKYGGIVMAAIEIIEFAVSKFERFDPDAKEEFKKTANAEG